MKKVKPQETTRPTSSNILDLYGAMTVLFVITYTTWTEFLFFGIISIAVTYLIVKYFNKPKHSKPYDHNKWLEEALDKLNKHK